jgi:hypothetical protein
VSTHPRRRVALAVTLGLLPTLGAIPALGAASPAGAGAAGRPSFQLFGGDRWFTHEVGWFPVVQGPAEVVLNGRRTLAGTLSATIQPDDHTMPAPGECESGITFVFVDGPRRGADAMLSSAGEICGHHVQLPTSVVTHTFTGIATIEESDRRRLEGREAFLEVRMAEDGRANVFATTW